MLIGIHGTDDPGEKRDFKCDMEHFAHKIVNALSVKQEKYRGDQNLIHPAKIESFAGRRGEVEEFYFRNLTSLRSIVVAGLFPHFFEQFIYH